MNTGACRGSIYSSNRDCNFESALEGQVKCSNQSILELQIYIPDLATELSVIPACDKLNSAIACTAVPLNATFQPDFILWQFIHLSVCLIVSQRCPHHPSCQFLTSIPSFSFEQTPPGKQDRAMQSSPCTTHDSSPPSPSPYNLHFILYRLWANVASMANITHTPPTSPIMPLLIGSTREALELSGQLLARGLHIPAIRPPTVAVGTGEI